MQRVTDQFVGLLAGMGDPARHLARMLRDITYEAVSYTHLDVYKRQGLGSDTRHRKRPVVNAMLMRGRCRDYGLTRNRRLLATATRQQNGKE